MPMFPGNEGRANRIPDDIAYIWNLPRGRDKSAIYLGLILPKNSPRRTEISRHRLQILPRENVWF